MNSSLEKIDPNLIPHRTLYTGAKIPAIGLGTFGSDRFTARSNRRGSVRCCDYRLSPF